MVKERMDLLELLRKGGMDGDVDFLREALEMVKERTFKGVGSRCFERESLKRAYGSRSF